jgi:hypothetical protein
MRYCGAQALVLLDDILAQQPARKWFRHSPPEALTEPPAQSRTPQTSRPVPASRADLEGHEEAGPVSVPPNLVTIGSRGCCIGSSA